MPLFLLALIGVLIFVQQWLPVAFLSGLYAISLSIKAVLIFVLPALIFMLLFKTMAQLARGGGTKMILFILAALCLSNFLSTMISYHVGSAVYQLDLSLALPQGSSQLMPAWTFELPRLIPNSWAMFGGLGLGLLLAWVQPGLSAWISRYFEKGIYFILRSLTYLIPFFVIGFVVKLIYDGVLKTIMVDYSLIFIVVALSLFTYIGLIYLAVAKGRLSRFKESIGNMLPSIITGFSSMSSAAAMPLTISATKKNSEDCPVAQLAIPTTVNTHLIGDCFAIPIFAFAVMKNFGMAEPLFFSYLIFALYFVIAKFSVAAIPGGGIIVMLPILESQFGFTPEMSLLITALYILFDPVITCANVAGNGAFAMVLSKMGSKIGGRFNKTALKG